MLAPAWMRLLQIAVATNLLLPKEIAAWISTEDPEDEFDICPVEFNYSTDQKPRAIKFIEDYILYLLQQTSHHRFPAALLGGQLVFMLIRAVLTDSAKEYGDMPHRRCKFPPTLYNLIKSSGVEWSEQDDNAGMGAW
ncbi:hypothetical protein B0H14DRAFT_2654423 [Mycena olivaceomarginata]|nr:hypothetical protein B0H14DRAFT_2654423 [Mycena olivaceomarginata]